MDVPAEVATGDAVGQLVKGGDDGNGDVDEQQAFDAEDRFETKDQAFAIRKRDADRGCDGSDHQGDETGGQAPPDFRIEPIQKLFWMNEGELQEEDLRPPAPFLAGSRGREVLSYRGAVLVDQ